MPTNTFAKINLPLILLFSSMASAAPKLPSDVKLIEEGTAIPGTPLAHKYQFSNGLKLIVLADSRNPLAAMHTILDAGSNREEKNKTGLAHFFEHMMFRKTTKTEEGHFDRVLSGVGGNGNAGTSTDFVVYDTNFPGPALDKILDLEAQRMMYVDLRDPYFTTEKGAVISERKLRYENDPSKRGAEVLRGIAERGTPYEWLTIGEKEDVAKMTIKSASDFHKSFYTPDNALMVVGGPFELNDVVKKVHDRFSGWKGKVAQTHKDFPKDYYSRDLGKTWICSEAVMEQQVDIIYPTPKKGIKELVYSTIFRQMLDDHPGGDFQRRLAREKIASKFYFYKNLWQRNNPQIVAHFSLTNDQTVEGAQKAWKNAVEYVLKKPLDARIRSRILKQQELDDAETASKMTSLIENYYTSEYFLGDFLASKKFIDALKLVSENEFRTWIKETLSPEKSYTTAVVKNGSATPCKDYAAKVKFGVKK